MGIGSVGSDISYYGYGSTSSVKSSVQTESFSNDSVVNGRFCPQSVRSFCPIVAGFNAGTYKVPACVL